MSQAAQKESYWLKEFMLQSIVVSRCRVKLLQAFLGNPGEIFYVRQLVRLTGEEINAVRRELIRMEGNEMVQKEPRGNRLYYWFNQNHVLYGDLLSMISKTIGLGGAIVNQKSRLGQIKLAMLSGRLVRGLSTKEGAVDLLLVGKINLGVLTKIVAEQEKKLGREINYTVMTKEEFNFRKKSRDPFLLGIITDARIMLIGNEMDLVF